jgi:hypothetical protein
MQEVIRYGRRGLRLGTWPLLQRFVVARKVLTLPPIRISTKSDFTVHIRICQRDMILLHWAVRSLACVCSTPFRLVLHDDGTCREDDLRLVQEKFQGVRIIRRSEAKTLMLPRLDPYPALRDWWLRTFVGIKWLDVYMLGESRYAILTDTDVLFFRDPVDLFQPCATTVWMRDIGYTHFIGSQESIDVFGGYPLPQLNSGLGRIERSRFRLDLADQALRYVGDPGYDDQTFNAIITAQSQDFALLDSTLYECAFEMGIHERIARHYTTPFRLWFYEEGLPRVARNLQLPLHHWLSERP